MKRTWCEVFGFLTFTGDTAYSALRSAELTTQFKQKLIPFFIFRQEQDALLNVYSHPIVIEMTVFEYLQRIEPLK